MTVETDKSTTGGSILYTAATEALVSEASASSTFEKMISCAYSHSTVETFKKEVQETEKQIRKEFEIGSMPGPWRSAKSVIQSAMNFKLDLVDDNGSYYGKTYLQSKIKELKSKTKDSVSEETYCNKIISLLTNVPEGIDKKSVLSTVKKWLDAA